MGANSPYYSSIGKTIVKYISEKDEYMKQRIMKNERGQAMVEFAIVLPFLLLILCGILDFGWIYYNKYKVEDASYQGARFAFVAESNQKLNNPGADININDLKKDTEDYVRANLLKDSSAKAKVVIDVTDTDIKVTVENEVQCLTFVGQGLFGKKYTAKSTSVASK